MHRTSEAAARAAIIDYIMRWHKYGKGTLFFDNGDPTNIGLKLGTERMCAELQAIRDANRAAEKEKL